MKNHFLQNLEEAANAGVVGPEVVVVLHAVTVRDVFVVDGDADCIHHHRHCTFPCLPFHPRGLSRGF